MMREIKFRAWDERSESWINNSQSPYPYLTLLGTIVRMAKEPCGRKGLWAHELESMVQGLDIDLMQYTGFRDRNGREIYEGDIVQTDYPHIVSDIPRDPCPDKRIILWDEEDGCLTFFWLDGKKQQSGLTYTKSNLERIVTVIGNIWENPDLIEEAKVE